MAIYANSYGMTDKRKPEFKLRVTTIEQDAPAPLVAMAASSTDYNMDETAEGRTWFDHKLDQAEIVFNQWDRMRKD